MKETQKIIAYLRRWGWSDPKFLADYFDVELKDMYETLQDLEDLGIITMNRFGEVNLPVEKRSWFSRILARFVG